MTKRDWMAATLAYVRSGEPDLTNRQMAIVITLGLQGQQTVRGLAAALNVSKPVITRAVNTLSSLGFARRVPDTRDARSVYVVPTPEGVAFLERLPA